MISPDQMLDMLIDIAGARDEIQQHGVAHLELTGQSFRFRVDEPLIGFFGPRDLAVARALFLQFLQPFRVVAGFATHFCVFDFKLRRKHDDGAFCIVAGSASSPCNLVEFTRLHDALTSTVEFCQSRHQYGADGNVNADAESVSTTDHFQQAGLSQFFDQTAVFWQHSRVMQADTAAYHFG